MRATSDKALTAWFARMAGVALIALAAVHAHGGPVIEIGRICQCGGDVTVIAPDGQARPGQLDGAVNLGDTIETAAGSRVQVSLNGVSVASQGELTSIRYDAFITEPTEPRSLLVRFFQGVTRLLDLVTPSRTRVMTGNLAVGIRGSAFEVEIDPVTGLEQVTLREGGPLVVTRLRPFADFADSLFVDPSDKSLETMDPQAFAAAAAAAGISLEEFVSDGSGMHELVDLHTAFIFDGGILSGPLAVPAWLGGGGFDPYCIDEPATAALLALALSALVLQARGHRHGVRSLASSAGDARA